MSASLISPSGTVLLHRARCCTEAAPEPSAKPVWVRLTNPERDAVRAEEAAARETQDSAAGIYRRA